MPLIKFAPKQPDIPVQPYDYFQLPENPPRSQVGVYRGALGNNLANDWWKQKITDTATSYGKSAGAGYQMVGNTIGNVANSYARASGAGWSKMLEGIRSAIDYAKTSKVQYLPNPYLDETTMKNPDLETRKPFGGAQVKGDVKYRGQFVDVVPSKPVDNTFTLVGGLRGAEDVNVPDKTQALAEKWSEAETKSWNTYLKKKQFEAQRQQVKYQKLVRDSLIYDFGRGGPNNPDPRSRMEGALYKMYYELMAFRNKQAAGGNSGSGGGYPYPRYYGYGGGGGGYYRGGGSSYQSPWYMNMLSWRI